MAAHNPRVTRTRAAALAAVLGGVAWIPIRIAISVTFSRPLLDLSYVEWNRLMVIPLGLQLLAVVGGLLAMAQTRGERLGALVAAAGLVGMLAGVIVEFWVFGGLVGNREGAIAGWMLYLLGGVLVHVIGLAIYGVASLRARTLAPIGVMALAIAVLHVAWIPATVTDAVLVADQALIGLVWVAIGATLIRRTEG